MTYATGSYDDVMLSGRLRRSRRRSSSSLAPVLLGLVGSAVIGGVILKLEPESLPSAPRPSLPRHAAVPAKAPVDPALALAMMSVPLGQAAPLAAEFAMASVEPGAAVVDETEKVAVVAEAAAPTLPVDEGSDSAVLPPPAAGLSPLVASVPLPVPRPSEFSERPRPGPVRRPSRMASTLPPSAAPPADNRSFFEKLFGNSQPSGPTLAYAAPEDGVMTRLFRPSVTASSDGQTAIYDISAHTVYLPDGTQLEAHSGLGEFLDDPRSMSAKNRGVTPPSLYDLTMREKPFHGVRALRLTPVGNRSVFGRVGLLAHTFMLGPNGDSNGCVSFRNYGAFLQAYTNGDVKRLAVVARRS